MQGGGKMSIKPIDAQIVYHSTPDIAKQQSIQTNKDENMQAQSAMEMQKKVEQDKEQVNEKSKVDKVRINPDEKRDNSQNQQQKKKKKNDQENQSTIDVRV